MFRLPAGVGVYIEERFDTRFFAASMFSKLVLMWGYLENVGLDTTATKRDAEVESQKLVTRWKIDSSRMSVQIEKYNRTLVAYTHAPSGYRKVAIEKKTRIN